MTIFVHGISVTGFDEFGIRIFILLNDDFDVSQSQIRRIWRARRGGDSSGCAQIKSPDLGERIRE